MNGFLRMRKQMKREHVMVAGADAALFEVLDDWLGPGLSRLDAEEARLVTALEAGDAQGLLLVGDGLESLSKRLRARWRSLPILIYCGDPRYSEAAEGVIFLREPLEKGAVLHQVEAALSWGRALADSERRVRTLEAMLEDRTVALGETRGELEEAVRQARSMAQAAQEASEAKSRFFDQVSHDIRTPMGGIVGMADVLASSGLTEEQTEYVDVLSESAEMLLNMLNDLLDISRIDSGRLTIESLTFNLLDVVEVAGQLAAPKAGEKGVELLVKCAPDVPERVIGDPTRLRQVLNNLLNNAVKFTKAGHVMLEAACVDDAGAEGGRWLRLAVSDTGTGIAEDKLGLVFERFVQEDSTVARSYGGSGLGLYICKDLVELMGGRIAAKSAKGKGAQFEVLLPCRVPDDQPSTMPSLLPSRKEMEHFRVLIAVRYALAGQLLQEHLERFGAEVVLVDGADAAFERLVDHEKEYNLVFLSEQLGDSDAETLVSSLALSRSQTVLMRPIGAMHRLPSADFNALFRSVLHMPYRRETLNTLLYRCCMQQILAQQNVEAVSTVSRLFESVVRRERILVVDESASNRLVVKNLLKRGGFARVTELEDGREALQLCAVDHAFDLVLVSLQLEDMDGCELVMRIRRMEGWREVPMVAMSTSDSPGDRLRSQAAGVNEYLAKPIRESGIRQVCGRFLGAIV
jgi:two-component system, sensor histidine kinase and response regulator